ncbi:MAG: ParA family protein [Nocardia sp.]|nr:ParA family protein [Nocardia sp.]
MTDVDVEITSETTARASRAGLPSVELQAEDRSALLRKVFSLTQQQAASDGGPVEVTIADAGRRRYVTVSPDGTAAPSAPSGPIPVVAKDPDPAPDESTGSGPVPAEPVMVSAASIPPPPRRAPTKSNVGVGTQHARPTNSRGPATALAAPSLSVPRTSPAVREPASRGLRGRMNNLLPLSLPPKEGSAEMRLRVAADMITAPIASFEKVAVVNPKGGVGKTPVAVGLASTIAKHRGSGSVVCADLAEIGGSLADRVAVPPFEGQDLVALLEDADAIAARPAALSRYMTRQPTGEDIIAGGATYPSNGRGIGFDDAAQLAEAVSHHREILIADTGNNRLAGGWQWALHSASVVVVPVPLRRDAAVAAHRMLLDAAETADDALFARTLVIITDGPGDQPMVEEEAVEAFVGLGIRVLRMPYEPLFANGERIVPSQLRRATTDSLTNIASWVIELIVR